MWLRLISSFILVSFSLFVVWSGKTIHILDMPFNNATGLSCLAITADKILFSLYDENDVLYLLEYDRFDLKKEPKSLKFPFKNHYLLRSYGLRKKTGSYVIIYTKKVTNDLLNMHPLKVCEVSMQSEQNSEFKPYFFEKDTFYFENCILGENCTVYFGIKGNRVLLLSSEAVTLCKISKPIYIEYLTMENYSGPIYQTCVSALGRSILICSGNSKKVFLYSLKGKKYQFKAIKFPEGIEHIEVYKLRDNSDFVCKSKNALYHYYDNKFHKIAEYKESIFNMEFVEDQILFLNPKECWCLYDMGSKKISEKIFDSFPKLKDKSEAKYYPLIIYGSKENSLSMSIGQQYLITESVSFQSPSELFKTDKLVSGALFIGNDFSHYSPFTTIMRISDEKGITQCGRLILKKNINKIYVLHFR